MSIASYSNSKCLLELTRVDNDYMKAWIVEYHMQDKRIETIAYSTLHDAEVGYNAILRMIKSWSFLERIGQL